MVLDTYNETDADSKSLQHLGPVYNSTLRDESAQHRVESGKNSNKMNIHEEPHIFEKVLVVGLGQLGLPVAKYLIDRGFETYGYDLNNTAMERAERIASVRKATNLNEIDVFIICVSTHKPEDMFSPQVDGLLSIVKEISRGAKNGALVSIESTIPRGTSKKIFEMLNHRLHVAHAPHRFYSLEEKDHGINQLRVIGGVCDCCLKNAIRFYGYSTDAGKDVIMNSKEGSCNSIVIQGSTTGGQYYRNDIG